MDNYRYIRTKLQIRGIFRKWVVTGVDQLLVKFLDFFRIELFDVPGFLRLFGIIRCVRNLLPLRTRNTDVFLRSGSVGHGHPEGGGFTDCLIRPSWGKIRAEGSPQW